MLGLATACRPALPAEGDALRVVATTNILADVVAVVGGDSIELSVLLPVGADPHSFEPSPREVAAVSQADLVFANGVGLEIFLQPLLESAGGEAELVTVSDGVETIAFEEIHPEGEAGEEHGEEDPHVWMDPNNILVWVDNIVNALARRDPANATSYEANAEAYKAELCALDEWIAAEVAELPEAQRELVTDHDALGYFARRYGFELVGAVVPGYSTLAQPSAQELAALEDAIAAYGVPAIFVGADVNPALAERVAEDTGVQLVILYLASLTEADGPAPTYLDMMRYSVSAIVEALK